MLNNRVNYIHVYIIYWNYVNEMTILNYRKGLKLFRTIIFNVFFMGLGHDKRSKILFLFFMYKMVN